MVNNGTGNCVITLLNPFREEKIYLDNFWTDSAINPIEFHDQTGLLFKFTKFDKPEKFVLESNFYRIFVPIRASFTVIGHKMKSDSKELEVTHAKAGPCYCSYCPGGKGNLICENLYS